MADERVLVVDDDRNICELIDLYLAHEGYSLDFCHDGSMALDKVRDKAPDLILLDVMLPVINGWEVCRMIRKISEVPIIFLTARDMTEDVIQGFELGADDYLIKPFEPRELVARVKTRIKRSGRNRILETDILQEGNLIVDLARYEVRVAGKELELKPKEIQLLHYLLSNKNIVLSREKILQKVWCYEVEGDTRTIDVHINRLRDKIEPAADSCRIKTVWGVGYKLETR